MKLSTIVACSLLVALSVAALFSAASVEVLVPSKSSRRVRITALLNGKPQPGVKIEIYRYELGPGQEAKPFLVLTSDEEGTIVSPKLATGPYHIVALADKNLRADLFLDVPAHSREKLSVFSMELVASTDLTPAQFVAQAEQMPIRGRLKVFRGVICDVAGARIPGVSIQVIRKGTEGKDRVTQVSSGGSGEFSATIPDGAYIAFFSAQGFKTQIVPFELTKDGSEDLRITLQLGDTR